MCRGCRDAGVTAQRRSTNVEEVEESQVRAEAQVRERTQTLD